MKNKVIYFTVIIITLLNSCSSSKDLPTIPDCNSGIGKAIIDSTNGNFYLTSSGLPIDENYNPDLEKFYLNYMKTNYNIGSKNSGCVINDAIKCYNDRMTIMIKNKYGVNFINESYMIAKNEHKNSIIDLLTSETIFNYADSLPSYIGGNDQLYMYLKENIKYNDSIKTKVKVNFIVEKNGELSNIQINKHINKKLDSTIFNAFQKMPKWKPALYYNYPVRFRLYLPLSFD